LIGSRFQVQITSRWSGAPAREASRKEVNRKVYPFAPPCRGGFCQGTSPLWRCPPCATTSPRTRLASGWAAKPIPLGAGAAKGQDRYDTLIAAYVASGRKSAGNRLFAEFAPPLLPRLDSLRLERTALCGVCRGES